MLVLYSLLFEIFDWHVTLFASSNFFDCIEHTGGLPDGVSFITASAYTRISFSFLNDIVCDLMLSNSVLFILLQYLGSSFFMLFQSVF